MASRSPRSQAKATAASRVQSPAPKVKAATDRGATVSKQDLLPDSKQDAPREAEGTGFFDGLQGALLNAFFPFLNVFKLAIEELPPKPVDERGAFSGAPLKPYHNKFADYVGVQTGSLWKILVAVLCYKYTVDFEAASHGWDFSVASWEMKVIYRDLFLMVVVAGGWDWLLYFSPLKERLNSIKFNKDYPDFNQFYRDFFWTLHATLLASLQEIIVMKVWACGDFRTSWTFYIGSPPADEESVPWNVPFFGSDYTPYFVMWTVTMLYWRIFHFYCIHRMMHPWWSRRNGLLDGDIGAFLYRHVHSHHHKSRNPTAFSGISMQPVESISYISAALIPLFFRSGCHPWIHLYTKLDLIIGAQIGHAGFDAPGGGSYFHQLHHAHFECNYGDSAGIPMDWLMGTFEDGSKYK